MNAKQIVQTALGELPDTATLAEIIDELRLQLAIEEGIHDIEAGRFYTHEEIKAHYLNGQPLPDITNGRASSATSVVG
jgi:predicted transcriptional regulator